MKSKTPPYNYRFLEILLVVVITIIAAFLRLNKISEKLPFTFDQAEFYFYVRDIVGGRLVLIGPRTGIEGFFLGPLYFYLLVPFYLLFKGHPLGGAMLDACFGILCTPAIYLLAKKLFSFRTAFIASIITCFSPLLINYSQHSWNPHPLVLFAILFYYAIIKVLEGKETSIILAFFCFACGLQLEIASAIYFIPTVIIIFYLTKFRPKKIIYWLIGLLILLISLLPQIVFNLRHQFLMLKALNFYLLNGPKTDKSYFYITILRFQQLFSTYRQVIVGNLTTLPIILLLLSIFNLINGLKTKKKSVILLICWLGVNFSLLFLTREHLWDHHYLSLFPAYIIITAFLFDRLLTIKNLKLPVYFLFSVLIINYFINYWPFRETKSTHLLFKDQFEAIDYIYKDTNKKPFNIFIYVPSVYDHPYRYIFEWYGLKKYGYLPTTDKEEKLVYFIIEPDLEIPKRREVWLNSKRNEGIIRDSKKFGGGLVIEKRERL